MSRLLARASVLSATLTVASAAAHVTAQESRPKSVERLRPIRSVRLCPDVESRPVRDLLAFAPSYSGDVACARISDDCKTLSLFTSDANGALRQQVNVMLPKPFQNRNARVLFGDPPTLFVIALGAAPDADRGCEAAVIDRATGAIRRSAQLGLDGVYSATVGGQGQLVVLGWRGSAVALETVLVCFDANMAAKWSKVGSESGLVRNGAVSGPRRCGSSRVVVLESETRGLQQFTLDGKRLDRVTLPTEFAFADVIDSGSEDVALLLSARFAPSVVTLDASGGPLVRYPLDKRLRSHVEVSADQLFLDGNGTLWRRDGQDIVAFAREGSLVRIVGSESGSDSLRVMGPLALDRDGSLIVQDLKSGWIHRLGHDGQALRSAPIDADFSGPIDPQARIEVSRNGDIFVRQMAIGGPVREFTKDLRYKETHRPSESMFTINRTSGTKLSWGYGKSPRIQLVDGMDVSLPGKAFHEDFTAIDARLLDCGVIVAIGLRRADGSPEARPELRSIRADGELAYSFVFPDEHAPSALACGVKWAVASNRGGSIWLFNSEYGPVTRYEVPVVEGASDTRKYFIKTSNGVDTGLIEVDPQTRRLREFALPESRR